MKNFLVITFLFILLSACNEDGSPVAEFFNTNNLPSQLYFINIHADTVFKTKNGAVITIRKDAISAKDSIVELEIKEAYNINDIVKAGLQTRSGKEILSSGGMIYLSAKTPEAKIIKQINISLPSDNPEMNMLLFSGKENKERELNWETPKPLPPNQKFDSIAEGKNLFRGNCASCHTPFKDATGPSLASVNQRLSKEWMNKWIRNSAQLISEGDPYANCIYMHWGKTAMTAFPTLTDAELDKLYMYLDQVGKNINPHTIPNFKASWDSCRAYAAALNELNKKKQNLIYGNGQEVNIRYDTLPNNIDSFDTFTINLPDNLIISNSNYAVNYNFNIEAFGWYNIDVFTKDIPGFEQSKLDLKINSGSEYNVFLIIPSSKIFVSGGLLKNQINLYGFYTNDGQIMLPQGKEAYILVFKENNDKFDFALHSFTTDLENHVELSTEEISKETFFNKINSFNFQGLTINANQSTNKDTIKKVNIKLNELQKLKPKDIECNCGT